MARGFEVYKWDAGNYKLLIVLSHESNLWGDGVSYGVTIQGYVPSYSQVISVP